MDGYWRIKQYSPNSKSGFTVTTIPITSEPAVWDNSDRLKFVWRDGREEFFPWASIVHAEYQPPTNPRKEGT